MTQSGSSEKKKNRALEWGIIGGLALILLILGLLLWFRPFAKASTAVIYHDKEMVLRIRLEQGQKEYRLEYESGTLIIEMNDYKVRVKESTCPGQDCVQQGYVYRNGDSIVCAHNKVVITLEGNQSEVHL